MTFAIAFLGALFAIALALLAVYTYVVHGLIPQIMKGVRSFVEEVGPRAVFERANLDPVEAMRQIGVSPAKAAATISAIAGPRAAEAVRVIFTCEDHGRCVGCPKVLAQFEAIVRHQGLDSFDEVERRCYVQLQALVASDLALEGESDGDRQRRIAGRVVEALVREGFKPSIARGVVWGCGKDARETFAGWLMVARASCQQLTPKDEEHAA